MLFKTMLEVPWNKNFNKKQDFKTFAKPKMKLHILMFTKSRFWTNIRLVSSFSHQRFCILQKLEL